MQDIDSRRIAALPDNPARWKAVSVAILALCVSGSAIVRETLEARPQKAAAQAKAEAAPSPLVIPPELLSQLRTAVNDCMSACTKKDIGKLTCYLGSDKVTLETLSAYAAKLSPEFRRSLHPVVELLRDHPELGPSVLTYLKEFGETITPMDARWYVCFCLPNDAPFMRDPKISVAAAKFLSEENRNGAYRPLKTVDATPAMDHPMLPPDSRREQTLDRSELAL